MPCYLLLQFLVVTTHTSDVKSVGGGCVCGSHLTGLTGLILLFMLNGLNGTQVVRALSSDMWKFHPTTQWWPLELPISQSVMNSAKIFTVCTVCKECTRGKGGAADFIVPMQFD